MDRKEILASVPIFSGLAGKHLKQLSKLMVPRSFKAGDAIVHEKDQPAAFFIVVSGKVEVVRGEAGGKPQVLATLGPGEFFGEMALFEGYPRAATVRAIEDTECLAMTGWDFRAELSTDAEITMAVLETVVRRLRELEERLPE